METIQIIIQFLVFFVLVDLVSKRYATLFLLFFTDAYFLTYLVAYFIKYINQQIFPMYRNL